MENGKKVMVISGINLFEGGPLSVYKDFLDNLMELNKQNEYAITIFVHKKELFKQYQEQFEIIELPKSRKNYLFRFYYEYLYFYFYSLKRDIDIWFSLHDLTPNVKAKERYVYCHNPSPFLKRTPMIKKNSKTNYYMSIFYKYFYQINIKKNTSVIVQQNWMRKEFEKMFGIDNIIVARPDVKVGKIDEMIQPLKKNVFIYSAFPRPFKNFEVICKAAQILEKDDLDFEVWLTINGSENAYSKMVYDMYKDVKHIHWLGLIPRDVLMQKNGCSDYMIFPSLLETWGLPVTEYEQFKKPMIVADLPYAHETVGTYDQVTFFNPESGEELAAIMKNVILGKHQFSSVVEEKVEDPFYQGWKDLIQHIF